MYPPRRSSSKKSSKQKKTTTATLKSSSRPSSASSRSSRRRARTRTGGGTSHGSSNSAPLLSRSRPVALDERDEAHRQRVIENLFVSERLTDIYSQRPRSELSHHSALHTLYMHSDFRRREKEESKRRVARDEIHHVRRVQAAKPVVSTRLDGSVRAARRSRKKREKARSRLVWKGGGRVRVAKSGARPPKSPSKMRQLFIEATASPIRASASGSGNTRGEHARHRVSADSYARGVNPSAARGRALEAQSRARAEAAASAAFFSGIFSRLDPEFERLTWGQILYRSLNTTIEPSLKHTGKGAGSEAKSDASSPAEKAAVDGQSNNKSQTNRVTPAPSSGPVPEADMTWDITSIDVQRRASGGKPAHSLGLLLVVSESIFAGFDRPAGGRKRGVSASQDNLLDDDDDDGNKMIWLPLAQLRLLCHASGNPRLRRSLQSLRVWDERSCTVFKCLDNNPSDKRRVRGRRAVVAWREEEGVEGRTNTQKDNAVAEGCADGNSVSLFEELHQHLHSLLRFDPSSLRRFQWAVPDGGDGELAMEVAFWPHEVDFAVLGVD
eukprot:INCI9111.2.p1 GENE.INCI9111.2~~INCI9111.2.p1  ORF type:complete len:554 (-),score=84.03 INCI9111.2:134-1795(-)